MRKVHRMAFQKNGWIEDPTIRGRTTLGDVHRVIIANYPDQAEAIPDRPAAVLWATEEEWRLRYPFRSPADRGDLSSRFSDAVAAFGGQSVLDVLALVDGDYLFVLNFVFFKNLLPDVAPGVTWWDVWRLHPAALHSYEAFIRCAKALNNMLKTNGTADFNKYPLFENATITGYRQPPVAGFSFVRESKSLCHGGGAHGVSAEFAASDFSTLLDQVVTQAASGRYAKSFRDYVLDLDWVTSGSCSIGSARVRSVVDGEEYEKNVRVKKTGAAYILDLDDLVEEALGRVDQVSKSFIKAELGKLRIAGAGDIHTYLKMSWILEYVGDSYHEWPADTLGESFARTMDRYRKNLSQLGVGYFMPFDYEGFDHQPTLDEMKLIWAKLVEIGLKRADPSQSAEYSCIGGQLLESFDSSFFEIPANIDDSKEKVLEPVTGGLISGQRITTLVGFIWNLVMSTWAKNVAEQLGWYSNGTFEIRGDDTNVVDYNFSRVLVMRVAYEIVGAIGGVGKFGIHHDCTEFLREWFEDGQIHGYPARAIPGIVQKKPWSPQPASSEQPTRRVCSVLDTLIRRGCSVQKVEKLRSALLTKLCTRRGMDKGYLAIPEGLGGLGLAPYVEMEYGDSYPKLELRNVTVDNIANTTISRISAIYKDFRPSEQEVAAIANSRAVSSIPIEGMGNIFSAAITAQRKKISSMKAPNKGQALFIDRAVALELDRECSILRDTGWNRDFSMSDGGVGGDFGGGVGSLAKWQRYVEVCRVRGTSPNLREYSSYDSGWVRKLRRAERRCKGRKEGIKWLSGDNPFVGFVYGLSPLSRPVWSGAVNRLTNLMLVGGRIRTRQMMYWQVDYVVRKVAEAVKSSSCYRSYFMR